MARIVPCLQAAGRGEPRVARRTVAGRLADIIRTFGWVPSHANVAELVDALVLGTSAARRASSSLAFRTIGDPNWVNNLQ